MRKILVLFSLIATFHSFGQSVLFGEHPKVVGNQANYICFDKNGWLYPDYFIPDSLLAKNQASLEKVYQTEKKLFLSLVELYEVPDNLSFSKAFTVLNDSIFSKKARQIQVNIGTSTLRFLIHGYRKSFKNNGIDYPSVNEFIETSEKLKDSTKQIKDCFVYWDGNYDCCYSLNGKKNKYLFKLFEEAYQRTDKIADALTKFCLLLNKKQYQFFGHSLGAKVAFEAADLISKSRTEIQLKTCLFLPAFGTKELLSKYKNNINLKKQKLLIIYNRKDFALRKKEGKMLLLGPGFKKYGATDLGCNMQRSQHKIQKENNSNLQSISMKYKGKVHSLRNYTREDLKTVRNFYL